MKRILRNTKVGNGRLPRFQCIILLFMFLKMKKSPH